MTQMGHSLVGASLALPIPWLSAQKDLPPPFTLEMLRIWYLEFLTFSPLLLLSLFYRIINRHNFLVYNKINDKIKLR